MKKKMSIGAALLLAVLYMLFGVGGDDSTKQAVSVVETIVQETVMDDIAESESLTGGKSVSEVESLASEESVSESESSVSEEPAAEPEEAEAWLDEAGTYTTKEDVALYIHQYGCLPSNFISKKEAQDLGWEGGSLEPYAPGKCIGGSHFGNYEGLLPEKEGRTYTECDIDTLGQKSRGAKRIVFSNDGLIYYTEDHYEIFELLYGDE